MAGSAEVLAIRAECPIRKAFRTVVGRILGRCLGFTANASQTWFPRACDGGVERTRDGAPRGGGKEDGGWCGTVSDETADGKFWFERIDGEETRGVVGTKATR